MSCPPDAIRLPEELCEGILEEFFESAYGDYSDEDYSHGSDSESISSPEWEPLQEDMDEEDGQANLDVDAEVELVEGAGIIMILQVWYCKY